MLQTSVPGSVPNNSDFKRMYLQVAVANNVDDLTLNLLWRSVDRVEENLPSLESQKEKECAVEMCYFRFLSEYVKDNMENMYDKLVADAKLILNIQPDIQDNAKNTQVQPTEVAKLTKELELKDQVIAQLKTVLLTQENMANE